MRLWIVWLFVLLLPLKSVAAAIVPIAGTPGHHHSVTAAQSHHVTHTDEKATSHADEAHHAGCPMFSATTGAGPGDKPHDHPCPHLGMASIPVASLLPLQPAPVSRPEARELQFASITLEVPSPPPTSTLAVSKRG
jgi:hypothetical protein